MDSMPRVEERQYIYTETVYLDGKGEIVATERTEDDQWYDTVNVRDWTEDEKYDYDLQDDQEEE